MLKIVSIIGFSFCCFGGIYSFAFADSPGSKGVAIQEYPEPTSSYSRLLAAVNFQEPVSSERMDGRCFRSIEKAVDIYNHHSLANYQQSFQKYKDIVDDLSPPSLIGEQEEVVDFSCSHFEENIIGISITTSYPQTIHVFFDDDLAVLSWAYGDINQR